LAISKKEDKMSSNFKLIKKTKFSEIEESVILPRSDLALQSGDYLFQFEFVHGKRKIKKTLIKPGTFMLKSSMSGLKLAPVELGKKRLLLDAVNSKSILDEANRFFSNLAVYEQLERQKKRGVLVYSAPGMGKSSTIAHFSSESIKEDSGTVVVVWPTSKIDADDVTDFFAASTKFSKHATRMVLILEDIGGSEHENRGPRGVDSGILNLLDGVSVAFKLPTFIVATTNHPENLLSSLADRPGRFDLMIELKAPAYQERLKLLEFIAKRPLSDEEKETFKAKDCDTLSIAHLDEIVVRSLLHGKTLKQTLREVLDHKKNVAEAFEKAKKLGGIGFSTLSKDDDDY
jgi:hypothetical protein